jgi:hypothetical protein
MINYPTNQTEFDMGSFVLVEYKNSFRRGPSSKLFPFLKGPMKVIGKNKSRYVLQDLISMKEKLYHVKRLTEFNYDPTKWDPLQIALRDTGDLFRVERISAYQGNPKGAKAQLYFTVHWVGYSEPSQEPWGNLRNNAKLHEFLRNHKQKVLRDLLPKNFASQIPIDSESEGDVEESDNEL